MPVLEINDDERLMLDIALMNHRGSLMKEWGQIATNEEIPRLSRDQECEWLDHKIKLTGLLRDRLWKATADADAQISEAEAKRRTAVAKMIISEIRVGEALHEGSIGPYLGGYPGEGMVWHHKHGWLQPTKYLKNAAADVEAGEITREDVAADVGVDLAELDVENARDRVRLRSFTDAFYKHALQSLTDNVIGFGTKPVTSTTLPEEVDIDAWSYAETDPEPTTAGIDVQTKNGKIRIDLVVGGRAATVEGDPEAAARLLRDLDLAQRGF